MRKRFFEQLVINVNILRAVSGILVYRDVLDQLQAHLARKLLHISVAAFAMGGAAAVKKVDISKTVGGVKKAVNVAQKPVNVLKQQFYSQADKSDDDGIKAAKLGMQIKDYGVGGIKTAVNTGAKTVQNGSKIAKRVYHKIHKSGTCGLHIHVNRETFGNIREAQDNAISRVLYFVEHHWNELLKFSRRTEKQMNQWAARYGYKNNPKEILDHAKNDGNSRYTCVNITNWDTVEFRMFRGTLKYNTLIATLELVNRICNLAVHCDDERLAKLSWSDFVMSLNESDCSELITYLKERRLYVNAPVEREEDE